MVRIITRDASSAILVRERSMQSDGHSFTLAVRKAVRSMIDTPAVIWL